MKYLWGDLFILGFALILIDDVTLLLIFSYTNLFWFHIIYDNSFIGGKCSRTLALVVKTFFSSWLWVHHFWREILKNIVNDDASDLFLSWLRANWLRHILALCVKTSVALLLIPAHIALVMNYFVAVSKYVFCTFDDILVYILVCTLSCSSSGNVACLYLVNRLLVITSITKV